MPSTHFSAKYVIENYRTDGEENICLHTSLSVHCRKVAICLAEHKNRAWHSSVCTAGIINISVILYNYDMVLRSKGLLQLKISTVKLSWVFCRIIPDNIIVKFFEPLDMLYFGSCKF